ncbi:hypothetical protein PIB30_039052 [Stylosanthes scabra]|uniref:Uncharacterized protein n=1 Tax=Stylosanthes scabra TaxID=79078 RepID=A0ABU6TDU7_9FABA|nr:hypothetical protein [Stylosanthes scabra]
MSSETRPLSVSSIASATVRLPLSFSHVRMSYYSLRDDYLFLTSKISLFPPGGVTYMDGRRRCVLSLHWDATQFYVGYIVAMYRDVTLFYVGCCRPNNPPCLGSDM